MEKWNIGPYNKNFIAKFFMSKFEFTERWNKYCEWLE